MKSAKVVLIAGVDGPESGHVVTIPEMNGYDLIDVKIVRTHRTSDWQDRMVYFGVYEKAEIE